jgi:hypothetical protein
VSPTGQLLAALAEALRLAALQRTYQAAAWRIFKAPIDTYIPPVLR